MVCELEEEKYGNEPVGPAKRCHRQARDAAMRLEACDKGVGTDGTTIGSRIEEAAGFLARSGRHGAPSRTAKPRPLRSRLRRVVYPLILAVAMALSGPIVGSASAGSSSAAPERSGVSAAVFDQTHSAWTAVLIRYVYEGRVDYAGLKKNGQGELASYLRSLQAVDRPHYQQWSRGQKLAFWINAYNAFTIRLILDHYPLDSIQSIGLLPGAAFRTSFIELPAFRPGEISLNDIEHEILRKQFQEPRIHFAIVCASKGCPQLRSEAYRSEDIDRQLDAAARGFVQDPTRNHFNPSTRTLSLSSIFNWFREDFEAQAGSLPAFVAGYAAPSVAAVAEAQDVRIEFLDYDWSLNGR